MELDVSVFDLEYSLHFLSPACSVHGRRLYRFPFLNLALSLLIDLHWSTIYSGMALQLKLELIMCGSISVSLAMFWTCIFLR